MNFDGLNEMPEATWQEMLTDPVREAFIERGLTPDLDVIMRLFPKTTGDTAFDRAVIESNINRLNHIFLYYYSLAVNLSFIIPRSFKTALV